MLIASFVYGSEPLPWQLGFQKAATPVMEYTNDFHNFVFVIMLAVVLFVVLLLLYTLIRFNNRNNKKPSNTSHNIKLEVIWTAIPIMIVCLIAVLLSKTKSKCLVGTVNKDYILLQPWQ